jgi:hypothetical protein
MSIGAHMPRHTPAVSEHMPLVITVEQMLSTKAKGAPRRSRERHVLRALRRMRRE